MTYATDIMNAAIEHSMSRCKELESNCASGWVDSKIGKVQVNVEAVDHIVTYRAQSFRKTWELNGKRVAAAKLAKALNEAAH